MSDASETPRPIALLARRSRNAKSQKERHDDAYWAWEASVRLGVAARPPADAGRLSRGSLGVWVGSIDWDGGGLASEALTAAYSLFAEVGDDRQSRPRAVSAAKLLAALPAYRNAVIGHGASREPAFYERAGRLLLEGLEAAWREGVFWPPGARLVYVEAVVERDGQRLGRGLDLSTERAEPFDGLALPGDAEAARLYVVTEGGARSLHPWLLYLVDDERARVLFFNGLGRAARYLDMATGETFRERRLHEAFPTLADDVRRVFSAPGDELAPAREDSSSYGDYRVVEKIGEGGMGEVHLAVQESMERHVALKTLPAAMAHDDVAVARFQREVRALARCEHPNVVRVFSRGEARGTWYYAMELVEGVNLAELAGVLAESTGLEQAMTVAGTRPVSPTARTVAGESETRPTRVPRPPVPPSREVVPELVRLFRDAAVGLRHLHEQGIVHRDLKPANIMVTAADRRPVIMDLGLALIDDASRSLTVEHAGIVGTLRYMPPEQLDRARATLDQRVDVYSLGATFYELLTGRPLYDALGNAQLIRQILHGEATPADRAHPVLGRDLSWILERATARDPEARYPEAGELVRDLDRYLAGESVAPPEPSFVPRSLAAARRFAKRRPAWVASLLVLVVALGSVWAASAALAYFGRAEVTLEGLRADDVAWVRAIDGETLAVGEPQRIGDGARLVGGDYRIVVERPGVGTAEFDRRLVDGEELAVAPRVFGAGALDDMVLVPAGPGVAGVSFDGTPRLAERSFELPAFHIDRDEVSNAAYLAYVEAGLAEPPARWLDAGWTVGQPLPDGLARLPVLGVKWADARGYAEWVGKRLPTWYEWSRAARGEEGLRFPGSGPDDGAIGRDPDYLAGAVAVESGAPEGPFALRHVYGNVREWTSTTAFDPVTGEPIWNQRIVMGRAFGNTPSPGIHLGSVTFADVHETDHGFRCAKSVEP